MNVYQSNIYWKNLRWLHFEDEPRVQEKQEVKDQQYYIYPFLKLIQYLRAPSTSTSPDMQIAFRAKPYGRFIEIQSNHTRKKPHKTYQILGEFRRCMNKILKFQSFLRFF